MKKSFLLTIFALLISTIVYSQVPQEFSYQSVIRDNTGKLVINQQVTVDIKIMSSTGTVYSENHSIVSSSNGLVSVDVGSKNTTSFSNILPLKAKSLSLSLLYALLSLVVECLYLNISDRLLVQIFLVLSLRLGIFSIR